jgi:hypothetical protein
MPLDWLFIWGVTQATGALVKPVLEDFAEDVVNDSAKEYVKRCFGNVFKPLQKDAHEKALGKALKELVQLIDDELRNAGVPESQTEAWAGDVKQFRRAEALQTALRQAFEASNSAVDGALLKQGWRQLPEISPLPPDFSWDYVAESFSRRLRSLRQQDSDLRQVLQTQADVETAANTRQALGHGRAIRLLCYIRCRDRREHATGARRAARFPSAKLPRGVAGTVRQSAFRHD